MNESSTQISIKKLGNSPAISHPAITVCLAAPYGSILSNFDENSTNISREEYNKLLNGIDNRTSAKLPNLDFQKAITPSYAYLDFILWRYLGWVKKQITKGKNAIIIQYSKLI